MKHKIIHHLQYAIGASILTILGIILIRGLEIPEIIHQKFFTSTTTELTTEIDNENTENSVTDTKIHTKISYEQHIQKGNLLSENNLDSLAIAEYENAIKENSSKAEPYFKIALIHKKNKDFEKALEFSEKAYITENGNSEYQNLYIQNLIRTNKKDQALAFVLKINDSANSETLYYKGIILALNENYEDSKKTFSKALELSSNADLSRKIQKFLDLYREFELTEGGQEIYRMALISQNLIQNEFYLPSIEILYEVIKEKYDYRDAWIMLGYSYLKTQNYFDAIEAFQTALDIDPVKAQTRYFLGLAYFGIENYHDAISNIEIALENGFQPKVEALQQLAEIAILNEEYEKAVESYKEVLIYKKRSIDIYIRPIWLLIEKLNQPEKAVDLASEAIEFSPDSALAYNLLGWAQTANGQYKNAYKNFEKAIEL